MILKNFLLLQSILALWIISKLLKTFAPNASLKFFFVVCQYAGVCFLSPFFVRFSHIFSKNSLPPKRLMYLLYGLSLAIFLVVATNPLHHLFYSHFDFWGDSFGPLFYVQQVIQFVLFFLGVLLCVRAYFASFRQRRIQAAIFAVAILIPIAANILYVFKGFKRVFGFTPPFDITPVSASISLALFAFATFRLELFDSLNVALETALSSVPSGILLISGKSIIYMNNSLQRMLGDGSLCTEDDSFFIECEARHGRIGLPFDLNKAHSFTIRNEKGGHVWVVSIPVAKDSAFVRFMDITEKQRALAALEMKNKALADVNERLSRQAEAQRRLVAAKARNDMAGEAHDILGHSVMLALSLLEMARLSNGESRSKYLERATGILRRGLPELRKPSLETKAQGENICRRLQELVGELSDMSVTVEISVAEIVLPAEIADALYKICRESITNALRHSGCGRIDVILRGVASEAQLYVIDDGQGCKKLEIGMGIRGMEERARALGGSVSCRTLGGRGFCVEAVFPVSDNIVLQGEDGNLSSVFQLCDG